MTLLKGTVVSTQNGSVPIESIHEGDMILNQAGEPVIVQQISIAHYHVKLAKGTYNEMYKVPKGSYGAKSDLYLTKGHRMLKKNGNVVLPEKLGFLPAPESEYCDANGNFTVYHIKVGAEHHLIVNEGCIVESWK